jgi:hypothetical protein
MSRILAGAGIRKRYYLVPCEIEPVTQVVNGDPPLIGLILIHVLFEQFGNTGISPHTMHSMRRSAKIHEKIIISIMTQPLLPGSPSPHQPLSTWVYWHGGGYTVVLHPQLSPSPDREE